MVGAIAFVPEEDADDTWRLLKPLLPPDMIEFTRYYEATWIGSSGNRPTVIIVKVREVRENSTSIPYNALF